MQFNPVRFTKADLKSMPEDEQVFMLVAGNHFNTMNALMRHILFLARSKGEDEVSQHAAEVSAHVFIRYLAGEVYEAWEFISQAYPSIKAAYQVELGASAEKLWLQISGYFNERKNALIQLRNNVAFHTSPKLTARAFRAMEDAEPFNFYVTPYSGNAFHLGAALAAVRVFQLISGKSDFEEGIRTISHEMMEVVGWFAGLIDEALTAQLARHVPEAFAAAYAEEILVPVTPLAEARTELFVGMPESAKASQR